MGKDGYEIEATFPEDLSPEQEEFVKKESIPDKSSAGDVIFKQNNENLLLSFIFTIPKTDGRSNIAALVSLFQQTERYLQSSIYNDLNNYKAFATEVFKLLIDELSNVSLINLDFIRNILPILYQGLDSGHVKIEIDEIIKFEHRFGKKTTSKDELAMRAFMEEMSMRK